MGAAAEAAAEAVAGAVDSWKSRHWNVIQALVNDILICGSNGMLSDKSTEKKSA